MVLRKINEIFGKNKVQSLSRPVNYLLATPSSARHSIVDVNRKQRFLDEGQKYNSTSQRVI
jgi:hypothetical protein